MITKEEAENLLKENGYRVTKPRLTVFEVLAKSKKPQNPYEIASKIAKKGEKVDVVTIYRVLAVFEKLGLVHLIKSSQKYLLCDQYDGEHCHFQFQCNNCREVSDLNFDYQSLLREMQKKFSGFEFTDHYMEFSGLCSNCKK